MNLPQLLRARTAGLHQAVDAAFGRFDLGDRAGYRAALTAHSRALAPIERHLVGYSGLPAFRPRLPLLLDDLMELGAPPGVPLEAGATPSFGEALGMLYVLEGSRLGGGVVSRAIPAEFPKSYLSATHLNGEWRALLAQIDGLLGPADSEAAVAGAERAFGFYLAAASGAATPRIGAITTALRPGSFSA